MYIGMMVELVELVELIYFFKMVETTNQVDDFVIRI